MTLLTIPLLALGLGCADRDPTSVAADAAVPASLVIVSGDDQTAPPGATLPEALVVRVADAGGTPISGQIVNWRVTAGGGSVFAGTGITNDDGIAQEWWTLGPQEGANVLEVRAVDAATGERRVYGTFRAQASTEPPSVLTSVQVTPASVTLTSAGAQTALQAVALDQTGSPMSATFAWSSSAPTVASVNSSGVVTAQANGTARVIATSGALADTALVTVSISTTPPPPSGDEPIFGSGATTMFFDDFEAYTSTSQLLSWQAVHPNRWAKAGQETIELSTRGGQSGAKTARITYLQGQTQQYRLLEAMNIAGDPRTQMATFWVRTMPNYEWINSTGNTHKILSMESSGGRTLLSFGTEPQTPALSAYGRLGELRPHFSIGSNNWNQNLNYDRVRLGPGGSVVQVNDGNWHRFTVRLTKQSSSGRGDGRVELWIDGIKVIEFLGDVAGRPEYGLVNVTPTKILHSIRFPSTMNAAPSRNQWIEYDDMRIWYR